MILSILLFLNVGGPELFVIALAVLLLFGPEKLPGIARTMGKFVREFKSAMNGVQDEITQAMKEPIEEMKKPIDSIHQDIKEIKTEATETKTETATDSQIKIDSETK